MKCCMYLAVKVQKQDSETVAQALGIARYLPGVYFSTKTGKVNIIGCLEVRASLR